jgi:hypothetical protein
VESKYHTPKNDKFELLHQALVLRRSKSLMNYKVEQGENDMRYLALGLTPKSFWSPI